MKKVDTFIFKVGDVGWKLILSKNKNKHKNSAKVDILFLFWETILEWPVGLARTWGPIKWRVLLLLSERFFHYFESGEGRLSYTQAQ